MYKDGYCFTYDLTLPLDHFYRIVQEMKERLKNYPVTVSGFGHIGDANLHLIVMCDEYSTEIYNLIEPFLYEYTAKVRGSVSSEHGIGFLKRKYLGYSKTDAAIKLMGEMKTVLDPNRILNPYKVL